MNADYVKLVRRFGGSAPYIDENGKPYKLRHETDFPSAAVVTDGSGNITSMPLLRRKPCFGRPERVVRGAYEVKKGYVDSDGICHPGVTRCGTCKGLSPGVFAACGRVSDERLASNPAAELALDQWSSQCAARRVELSEKQAYAPPLAKFWDTFLDAIVAHGGWFSVNDENVRLDDQQRRDAAAKKKNADRRDRRKRARETRRGTIKPITEHYMDALQDERDRRADQLKRLGDGQAARGWLSRMPDASCDRIADVWQARELLVRDGRKPTGTAIAQWMILREKNYGLEQGSLTARVCEDLRVRLPKLEDHLSGAPVWPKWEYTQPSVDNEIGPGDPVNGTA